MLTKYFKYCQQMPSSAFKTRFPSDGNIKGNKVTPNLVPAWMKLKRKTADPKSTKSEAMLRADSLSGKTFTVRHVARASQVAMNTGSSHTHIEHSRLKYDYKKA
jgi:hypothetical protein